MEPVVVKSLKLSEQTDARTPLVDRISNLPPDLIGNILSFLPTKEAVATCVLSTKWKSFWTFITRLKFVHRFTNERPDPEERIRLKFLKESFVNSVYQVLHSRKPIPLKYFGLNSNKLYFVPHFRAWVSAVLSVGVEELDLSIYLSDASHVLPSNLFSCKSLVKLTLGLGKIIDVPPIVSLPSIKVLALTNVGFRDDDSLRRFLMGCPALEELEISSSTYTALPLELFSCRKLTKLKLARAVIMNPPTLVFLPSLKTLHLFVKLPDNEAFRRFLLGCPSLQELNLKTYGGDAPVLHIDISMLSNLTISLQSPRGLRSKVVLDTPSLRYLTVKGIASESLEVTGLSQLVKADISFIHVNTPSQVVSNLIVAISKVQELHLCGFMMEVIVKQGFKLPKFVNLTTLKLGGNSRGGWALLPDLLENAPVLETLVFLEGLGGLKDGVTSTWREVPYCLTHHLKVIQVNYFRGDGSIEEEEIMRYFIENRGDMKDLTIQYSKGSGYFWDSFPE